MSLRALSIVDLYYYNVATCSTGTCSLSLVPSTIEVHLRFLILQLA